MRVQHLAAGAISALALAAAAPAANAMVWVTQLEYDLTGQISSLGTVTIYDGADAANGLGTGHEVDVVLHLNSGFVVDTGNGHVAFAFNLVDDANNVVTPTDPTGVYTYANTFAGVDKHGNPVTTPPPYTEQPFGDFHNAFDVDTGGNNPAPGGTPPVTFSFKITNSVSTISFAGDNPDIDQTTGKLNNWGTGIHLFSNFDPKDEGKSGWWFGVDTSGTDSNCHPTCAIGGRDAFTTVTNGGVPEPGAWAMMLVGFGGLGAMLRRRKAAAAVA